MKIYLENFKKFICMVITIAFIVLVSNISYGDTNLSTNSEIDSQTKDIATINSNIFKLNKYTDLNINSKEEYSESSFRRFEIIFFISIPISFLLTLGGTLLYKEVSGNSGNFNNIEYSYVTLSTITISFSVALRDYFITKQLIER